MRSSGAAERNEEWMAYKTRLERKHFLMLWTFHHGLVMIPLVWRAPSPPDYCPEFYTDVTLREAVVYSRFQSFPSSAC